MPSKVLLDEPYPTNLPVVPACRICNESFALDEEYVACLIECTLAGSVNPEDMERKKLRETLRRRSTLASRLEKARQRTLFGDTVFSIEPDRVRKVVLKLARGHIAFELSQPQYDEPASVMIAPMPLMTAGERDQFEGPPAAEAWPFAAWPEVGSRAMQRIAMGQLPWVEVQPNRYRYLATDADGLIVRMVLSEYLACEVRWE